MIQLAKVSIGILSLVCAVGAGWTFAYRPAEPPKCVAVGTAPGGAAPGKLLTHLQPELGHKLAAFSEGCFWGTEKLFRHTTGVTATAVGYMGGRTAFPSYEQAHQTGHAETVLVEYDPKLVTYKTLLTKFWQLRHPHKSASEDQRHPFRSAIWTYDPDQLAQASESLSKKQTKDDVGLATRVQPAQAFYLAEAYHQQYSDRTETDACPILTE